MVVIFNFHNGLPNLKDEDKNSEACKKLLSKFKNNKIIIPDVPVLVGAKIMINSFYDLFDLKEKEKLIWDLAFDADENSFATIVSVGIHKQHLELLLE